LPDFAWTQAHAHLRPRAAAQAAFERLGYRFTASQPASGRPQRPRAIGESADRHARVELIGPVEVVFKATILAVLLERTERLPTPSYTKLADFLTVMIPDWEEGTDWLKTHWINALSKQHTETRVHDFRVALRLSDDGARIVLGITWQPAANAQENASPP
jgi:hypothetical protein